jgi:hypothetical protein
MICVRLNRGAWLHLAGSWWCGRHATGQGGTDYVCVSEGFVAVNELETETLIETGHQLPHRPSISQCFGKQLRIARLDLSLRCNPGQVMFQPLDIAVQLVLHHWPSPPQTV